MGFLGAQQRRTDPMSGLVQMGARSYDPSLGAFLSEDPVFGAVGIGTSFDRYAYAWDNPLNLYDLDGRFPSLSDVGSAVSYTALDLGDVVGDGADAAWGAGRGIARTAGAEIDDAWDWTAPGRQWAADRAQDFWKVGGGYVTSCLGNGLWGAVFGAGVGAVAGGAGAVPGAIAGGLGGCGEGLLQQGLRDAGQDEAAEAISWATAARNVGKAGKALGRELPELSERLKDLKNVFF